MGKVGLGSDGKRWKGREGKGKGREGVGNGKMGEEG